MSAAVARWGLMAAAALTLIYLLVAAVIVTETVARNQHLLAVAQRRNRAVLRELRADEAAICQTVRTIHFTIGVGLLCPHPPPTPRP